MYISSLKIIFVVQAHQELNVQKNVEYKNSIFRYKCESDDSCTSARLLARAKRG